MGRRKIPFFLGYFIFCLTIFLSIFTIVIPSASAQYDDYPSYPGYDSYPSYPGYDSYPSYPGYDSYPSYPVYDTYPSYPVYDTYPSYPVYDVYPAYPLYDIYPAYPVYPPPTPTPTPTLAVGCSSYQNCSTCISGAPFDCGWTGSPTATGSFCQTGTSSCPGTANWYWFDCVTNVCAVPPTPTPTPTPGPTCTSTFAPVCTGGNPCSDFASQAKDCTTPSLLCQINPFCTKYTGNECCTGPISDGFLGFDFCQGQQTTNPLSICQAPNWIGFQCCGNPAPTPTPTPTPTPVPCVLSDEVGSGWNETCRDATAGSPYRDYCSGNTPHFYFCSGTGFCTDTPQSSCSAVETCEVQPNGQPLCVSPPQCPPPTSFFCTVINDDTIEGDWTQSVPVGNYLLEACPQPDLSGSPSCTTAPLTSGSFNFVTGISPGIAYNLDVRVENNVQPVGFCTPPSNWSNRSLCSISNISGIVFVDDGAGGGIAENGIQDGGEVGYSLGTPVSASGPTPKTTTTDASGNYLLTALAGGLYTVTLTVVPAGFTATTPTSQTRTLPPSTIVKFGIKPSTVTIQGHHVDSSGSDFVLPGQTVTVSGAGSTTSTPTWFFNTLSPGTYTVTADNIAGYTTSFSSCINCTIHTTYTSGNSVIVSLPTGGNYADIFFKYTPLPCHEVKGHVWVDSNDNCAKDPPEVGFNGANVGALLPGGGAEKTDVTHTDVIEGAGYYDLAPLCLSQIYSIFLSVPANYQMPSVCPGSNVKGVNFNIGFDSSPATRDFFIVPLSTISGRVFVDTNVNGVEDPSELGFSGATVTASGPTPASDTTDGSVFPTPNYSLVNLTPGAYTVTLTVPAGFTATTTNPVPNQNVPPNKTVNFGIAPANSISGNVFVDGNENKLKDVGEANFTSGTSTIGVHTGTSCSAPLTAGFINPISTSTGAYDTGLTLPDGTYTVCYVSLPAGFQMTFPTFGLPPFNFTLTVGPSCNASAANPSPPSPLGGTCTAGSISNANFGITTSPWFSSKGVDMRIDNGFNDSMTAGKFASLDATGSLTPGIIFSGSSEPTFGAGSASSTNWKVGNFSFPEIFTPSPFNTIKTSYSYLLAIAQKNEITPADIAPSCGGSILSCTLSLPLDPGLFIANGNLNIVNPSFTIPSNQDYVILVTGNLTINGEIHVPNGSTATFSVSGNIIVDNAVGTSAPSATTSLEGFYSTDGNFIVNGNNDCSIGPDLRLNIGGTVVTNASLLGGSLQNNRDLCAANADFPSLFITERPDFILNSPLFIQSTQTIWQEVAP